MRDRVLYVRPHAAGQQHVRAHEASRHASALHESGCVRAGALGALQPYFPTRLTGGATPWATTPNLFTGECKNEGGASWLQVNDVRQAGDDRIKLADSLGPTWGLHLYDGQIALGNLTAVVQSQADAYTAHN